MMDDPVARARPIVWTIWYGVALVIVIMALYDFSPLKKGHLKRIALIGTVLGIVFFGSVKGYYVYTEGLRIEERGVELMDYQPFKEKSDLAELDGESSFKLDSKLPRLDGATALYPLYASFVEAVYPSGEYNPYGIEEWDESPVVSTTTGEAYDRLIRGGDRYHLCCRTIGSTSGCGREGWCAVQHDADRARSVCLLCT